MGAGGDARECKDVEKIKIRIGIEKCLEPIMIFMLFPSRPPKYTKNA
jgi:hypothetical protein